MSPLHRADLHIHTCLSPCGEREMTPRAIVLGAAERGIDIIGICDHNAAGNAPAAIRAAATSPVTVIAGIEVTTREEVHVVGLFETAEDALDMQVFVQSHLDGENDAEIFGPQELVDETDQRVGECKELLIGATDLSLRDVVDAIHARGGCAIAAHVDRERFGLIGQLGFIPPDLDLDGLEHSTRVGRAEAVARFGDNGRWSLVCSSDAHRLEEIGTGTSLLSIETPTAGEIRLALRREGGRAVVEEG
ncbi:PHP domain-containing protein [Candidatus Sumerlaeota bacterium]|nr:PHP domain-containing protein [Candidatus Sumerlaeota bacterium]